MLDAVRVVFVLRVPLPPGVFYHGEIVEVMVLSASAGDIYIAHGHTALPSRDIPLINHPTPHR